MTKKIHQDVLVGCMIIALCAIFYFKSLNLADQAAAFPRGILALFVFFAILIVINGLRKTNKMKKGEEVEYDGEEENLNRNMLASPLIVLGMVVAYVVLVTLIGFFLSTILFMAGFLLYREVKDWKAYVYTIVGLNLFIYLLFVVQLNVQLPQGILFE